MKDVLYKNFIEVLQIQYFELSFTELTITEDSLILKQCKTDDNIMKYEVFSIDNKHIELCAYELDGKLIGIRNIILSEEGNNSRK